MKEGPSIAAVAALIGDPARANMLQALMQVPALSASELAREAGVTAQTASGHLARLQEGGLQERVTVVRKMPRRVAVSQSGQLPPGARAHGISLMETSA